MVPGALVSLEVQGREVGSAALFPASFANAHTYHTTELEPAVLQAPLMKASSASIYAGSLKKKSLVDSGTQKSEKDFRFERTAGVKDWREVQRTLRCRAVASLQIIYRQGESKGQVSGPLGGNSLPY